MHSRCSGFFIPRRCDCEGQNSWLVHTKQCHVGDDVIVSGLTGARLPLKHPGMPSILTGHIPPDVTFDIIVTVTAFFTEQSNNNKSLILSTHHPLYNHWATYPVCCASNASSWFEERLLPLSCTFWIQKSSWVWWNGKYEKPPKQPKHSQSLPSAFSL